MPHPPKTSWLRRCAPIAFGLALMPLAPAEAASLYEALATAYAANPTLEAARANLRAIDENVPQVLSEWRPSVIGQAQAGHERQRLA